MDRSIPLLLFAKAPVAGKVKTRLLTHCSAEQAAQIAQVLLQESVRQASMHWPGEVILSVWPDAEHTFVRSLVERYQLQLAIQPQGNLGDKMHNSMEQLEYPVAVMGSDVPHIPPHTFSLAHQALLDGGNVIGPSEDGGYYLLGLSQSSPTIFQGLEWGGPDVFAATKSKAQAVGLGLTELARLYDIDTWDDVQRLAPELPSLATLLADFS